MTFFGLKMAAELVEPLVGHLDDADVELHAAESAGLGVAPGERVEDGRLARSGKTDDGDLHGPMLPVAGAQYPAVGSTTLSSGSPAA